MSSLNKELESLDKRLDILNTEFDNIATAVNSKSNKADPTFTGTMTAVTVNVSGTLTAGTITGGTF